MQCIVIQDLQLYNVQQRLIIELEIIIIAYFLFIKFSSFVAKLSS